MVDMYSDLTADGLGVSHCANRGDELIIRRVNSGYLNCIVVSHEGVTDSAFGVAPNEIELIGSAIDFKCAHCAGIGKVETDNNGPIGKCPVCRGTGWRK